MNTTPSSTPRTSPATTSDGIMVTRTPRHGNWPMPGHRVDAARQAANSGQRALVLAGGGAAWMLPTGLARRAGATSSRPGFPASTGRNTPTRWIRQRVGRPREEATTQAGPSRSRSPKSGGDAPCGFPRGRGQMPATGSSHSARSTVATGVRAARQAGPMAARLATARADTTVPAIMIVEMTGWGTT
jgi:hypothetical protein